MADWVGEACGLREKNKAILFRESASADTLSEPGRCFATRWISNGAHNMHRGCSRRVKAGSQADFLLTAKTTALLSQRAHTLWPAKSLLHVPRANTMGTSSFAAMEVLSQSAGQPICSQCS